VLPFGVDDNANHDTNGPNITQVGVLMRSAAARRKDVALIVSDQARLFAAVANGHTINATFGPQQA
jgi:hypothetical protein